MGIKSAILASALAGALSLASSAALAVTYDLTLSNLSGQTVGSGMFTISGPAASSGTSNFSAGGGLTDLSFTIGSNTFNLTTGFFVTPTVTFNNGTLASITYLGDSTTNGFKLDLDTFNLDYVLFNLGNLQASAGTISDHVSTTPLPSGLPLFITGLVALALIGWKRKRSMQMMEAARGSLV